MKLKRKDVRRAFVGVRLTDEENELLRQVAFNERTSKSSLLRRLFVWRYIRGRYFVGEPPAQEKPP